MEPIQPSNKLAQTTPKSNEWEENGRRGFIAPPASDPGCSYPCAACETCEAESGGRCNWSQADADFGFAVYERVDLLDVVGVESHNCLYFAIAIFGSIRTREKGEERNTQVQDLVFF